MRISNIFLIVIFVILMTTFSFAQIPIQENPVDDVTGLELPVTISWNWPHAQPVARYNLEVTYGNNLKHPALNIFIQSTEISEEYVAQLNDNYQYNWRVRAEYLVSPGQYEWSDWSEVWSFSVGEGLTCQGMCGNANGDASLGISDAVYIINYVFVGGSPPLANNDPYTERLACGDFNGDGKVNVSDAVAQINYTFIDGDPPGDCAPGSWSGGNCCPF